MADRSVSSPLAQSPGPGAWRRTAPTKDALPASTPPVPPTATVPSVHERTNSKPDEPVRPNLLASLAKKEGGWRARAAAKGEDGSGNSSPTLGLSRPSSGMGSKRSTTTPIDSPKTNGKGLDDGEWNEVTPRTGSYRPPQSRTNSGAPGTAGGTGAGRTASGRGSGRW
ncbi:hypothetical protein CROQUDRAFT_193988 [Cronartium quercuum f. sp. fusiforme G11]|uniref:Uncharacterized protein n=1 Tax=Cronartium quercuum f. sp. fusiforme G11 TaxID=708437 RepID=A0A9P6N7J3_9BASI|nr:hypothetical protein CROQUDRAFT_193988 [Cronartium quercuum f. sp. fusiforme G11]